MNVLKNMSAPPRSEVYYEQYQLSSKYICFNPYVLKDLLHILSDSPSSIAKAAEKYVKKHPNIIKNIAKPTGYMVSEYIELGVMSRQKIDEALNNLYSFEICNDVELLILVFGSTVGDLYIPNRPLSFEDTKFNKVLLFPKEEVES